MTEITVTPAQHRDGLLCRYLGAALGQGTAWSIEHRPGPNDSIILVFPDSITRAMILDAVQNYVRPVDPPTPNEVFVAAITAATTIAELKAAIIARFS